ncbi:DUF2935 domain-containing protein [Cohnella pontilimi]|uniref:DUF2935 domain-containing protein n=1 Tax=Cohnella pontilimi TaxID=2564100 RepID=A0A4U0FGW1_9BACL|nr:DUF2935 domain-containing protein [Cohnella pontilimi]TJY44177.1 DUF2935 domain-containing protein [Cohnella pontilimi]
MNGNQANAVLYEHRFWLQIMGDHGRFILNALSPSEKGAIERAEAFIRIFDQLLGQARAAAAGSDLSALNREAMNQVTAFRAYKLDLLARLLVGKLKIMLTPTFLNHMVNELEEYARVLQAVLAGQPVPAFDPLHHDLLWLPDAAGHAGAIAADLDMVEKKLIHKSKDFEKHFNSFYLKAIEMGGYVRTNLTDFPAFRRFHREVGLEIRFFMAFLAELLDAEITAEVLGRISPLIPDHMMREECYYLSKLSASGLIADPRCDPTRTRVEA